MRPLALAVAAVLVLAGCRSSADTAPVPSSPGGLSSPQAVPLPIDQAKKGLLSAGDLPPGWEGGEPEPVEATAEDVRLGTYRPAECLEIRHPQYELGKASTAAQASFSGSGDRRIFEEIRSWPTPQRALVEKVVAVAPRCATFTMTTPDATEDISFAVSRVPLAGVTDGVGVRVEITGAGGGLVEYIVHVVRGGTVLHLQLSGTGLDEGDVARIVNKANVKLDAVTK